jgi:hypothetical protein
MLYENISNETETAQEINKIRVGGTDYKYDYNGLLNRPAFMDVTEEEVIVDHMTITFTTPEYY